MVRKSAVPYHHSLLFFLVATIFSALFVISVVMFWQQTHRSVDAMVHEDVVRLQKVFQKIHQDCKILSFDHEKNYIDFLTVKEFVGDQVGAMNLAVAKFWKGPYLKENPEVQEHAYVILKNKQGYFIVPGDGVVLSNGKIVGKDIVLHANTDMKKMMQNSNGLKSSAGVLAAPIEVVKNHFLLNASTADFFNGNE
ncbi:hypothetical protein KBB68_00235 [Candidatus Babeliales bacterium]|nr:hypothetical protein [Candidatus Babeliales bacterium]